MGISYDDEFRSLGSVLCAPCLVYVGSKVKGCTFPFLFPISLIACVSEKSAVVFFFFRLATREGIRASLCASSILGRNFIQSCCRPHSVHLFLSFPLLIRSILFPLLSTEKQTAAAASTSQKNIFVIAASTVINNQNRMASNGHGNAGSSLLILYKIVNSESDGGDEALFNAFSMPRGSSGPTLAAVKQ